MSPPHQQGVPLGGHLQGEPEGLGVTKVAEAEGEEEAEHSEGRPMVLIRVLRQAIRLMYQGCKELV